MSLNDQRLIDYLTHIVDAIARINSYVKLNDKGGFLQNQMAQDAVVRNIEIIGEASRNISTRYPKFAAGHPKLQLGAAYQMRNVVAHGYFNVDLGIVWNTIQSDLPKMSAQVQTILRFDLIETDPPTAEAIVQLRQAFQSVDDKTRGLLKFILATAMDADSDIRDTIALTTLAPASAAPLVKEVLALAHRHNIAPNEADHALIDLIRAAPIYKATEKTPETLKTAGATDNFVAIIADALNRDRSQQI